MPARTTPLVTEEIYHVFNRGINRMPTFTYKKNYQRAIQAINFYRFMLQPVKLSKFLTSSEDKQVQILEKMQHAGEQVQILAFCLMPNHFHFLLKQKQDRGISRFLSNFQNSYTRYFNSLLLRDGPIFLDQFKAVRVETDEQLMHVSRYIHLNPYTGFVVKSLEDLEKYQWSSLPVYLNGDDEIINSEAVLSMFKSVHRYKRFIFDQADYQRLLYQIKHLILE